MKILHDHPDFSFNESHRRRILCADDARLYRSKQDNEALEQANRNMATLFERNPRPEREVGLFRSLFKAV